MRSFLLPRHKRVDSGYGPCPRKGATVLSYPGICAGPFGTQVNARLRPNDSSLNRVQRTISVRSCYAVISRNCIQEFFPSESWLSGVPFLQFSYSKAWDYSQIYHTPEPTVASTVQHVSQMSVLHP